MDNLEHKLKESMLSKQTSHPVIDYLGYGVSFNRETGDFSIVLDYKVKLSYQKSR